MRKPPLLIVAAGLVALAAPALAQYGGAAGFVREFDRNGDKVVTADEFKAARDERFAQTDLNHDGGLDEKEYVAEYTGRLDKQLAASKKDAAAKGDERKAQLDQAHLRFGLLDGNHDGKIDKGEYDESGQFVFKDNDLNKDGKITADDDAVRTAKLKAP